MVTMTLICLFGDQITMENRDIKLKEKIEKKYQIYQENILEKENYYNDLKVIPKSFPEIDGKCGTFFHMITKKEEIVPCKLGHCKYRCPKVYNYNPLIDDTEEHRMICQKRLDKIDYLKDFDIGKYKAYEKYMSTPKGKKDRIVLIDEEHNYIYVLENHKTYILLWTGYDIPKWKMKKELNNYQEYIDTGKILD